MFFRAIRLFARSLTRIADALERILELYELDLESRGIRRLTKSGSAPDERVEVLYSSISDVEE